MKYLNKEQMIRHTVKDIALGIADRERTQDFQASDGWRRKFMEMYQLSFPWVTNLIALSVEKLLECSFEYMKFLQAVLLQSQPQNMVIVDETADNLEDSQRTMMITSIGSKHFLCKVPVLLL